MSYCQKFFNLKTSQSEIERREISLVELIQLLRVPNGNIAEFNKSGENPKTFSDLSVDQQVLQSLIKKVRRLLNKLTPQKFETLCLELKRLPIVSSLSILEETVELIFEKAIEEEIYCPLYAAACQMLKNLQLAEKFNNRVITFGKVLEDKCSSETDRLILQSLDDRKKALSLTRFIGELYKTNLVEIDLLLTILQHTIYSENEKDLEIACKLLTVCGRQLQHKLESDENTKYLWNNYWSRVLRLTENQSITNRIRFSFLDLKELQERNWMQRAIILEKMPKTFEEIRMEVENEWNNKADIVVEDSIFYDKIETSLISILSSERNDIFNRACNWISSNVGENINTSNFIFTLTKAILQTSIINDEINLTMFERHEKLLKKYIEKNVELEVASINAVIQLLIVKNQFYISNLCSLFQYLYDGNTISHKAFTEWLETYTKSTNESKSQALLQLGPFFENLRKYEV